MNCRWHSRCFFSLLGTRLCACVCMDWCVCAPHVNLKLNYKMNFESENGKEMNFKVEKQMFNRIIESTRIRMVS